MTNRVQAIDNSADLMRSILWQYEGAPKMVQLAQNDQTFMDGNNAGFWDDWIRDVFDLTTANEFGLAVWARILNYQISISSLPPPVGAVWGFSANNENFEQAGFGIPGSAVSVLRPDDARVALLLRWFRLTMRPTVPNINRAIAVAFGANAGFVAPNGVMKIKYFFTQPINFQLRDLFDRTDALPRPAAVGVVWDEALPAVFGFGVNHLGFEDGSFAKGY